MNNKLEECIRCPLCESSLKKINNTSLECCKSKHRFRVEGGIPILLDYPNLHDHSQKQQFHFEKTMHKPTVESLTNMKPHEIAYLERFNHNFRKIRNKIVLEVGTGNGYMSIGLAKAGAKVIATDLTLTNLVTLKRLVKRLGLGNNLSFVCCSVDQLPFKSEAFDYFVINAVLEHIPREMEAIGEIKRTLKKRGGLMITVPVKYKYIFPPLLPINLFHDYNIGHLRRYDEVSLKNKFRGFQLIRTYFTGHPRKVIKVIINMIIKLFDEKVIEEEDAKRSGIKMWSSNLIAFLYKK